MKIRALTVAEACGILDTLGCSDDPLFYRGHETSPNTIMSCPGEEDPEGRRMAGRVRIEYYGGRELRRRRGTLQSMVIDRLRPERGAT